MPSPLQQIEGNLAEIAVSRLSEKNPALLNYYLGFDIVDKNEDGTRAAGLMGFKIGSQLLYIPVFFLGGKVKGMEVLYLKNSDVFTKNSVQEVNRIISQETQALGGPAGKTEGDQTSDTGAANSLRIFARPPASSNSKVASEIIDEFIDVQRALSEPESDLVDFLTKSGEEVYRHFVKLATSQPEILKATSRLYDLDDLKITFPETKKMAKEESDTDLKGEDPRTVKLVLSEEFSKDPEKAKDLTEEEKEKAMRSGYHVEDSRGESEKSDVLLSDVRTNFSEVSDSGYYRILNSNKKFIKVLVFVDPKTKNNTETGVECLSDSDRVSRIDSRLSSTKLIVEPETGLSTFADKVVASGGATKEDFTSEELLKVLEGCGESVRDAKIGNTYIVVSEGLGCFGPFEIQNKTTSGATVTLSASPVERYGWSGNNINIRGVETTSSNRPEFIGQDLFVPSCCKIIKLKLAEDPRNLYCDKDKEKSTESVSDKAKITPATEEEISRVMISNTGQNLVAEKHGAFDYALNFAGETRVHRTRGEMVYDLASRSHLSLDAAEKVASLLFSGKQTQVRAWTMPRIKVAYPDAIPNDNAGNARDGTPIQTPGAQRAEMMPASPGPQPPATDLGVGDWRNASKEDIDFLQRASDSNSRQVFDPAMIGVLVRTSRSQSIVQDYVPELVDNLDRMCRLLLLFYWHNKDFSDEYGIDEMADFEDLLLSAIDSTSKVVLFLKQRAVESSTGRTDVLE